MFTDTILKLERTDKCYKASYYFIKADLHTLENHLYLLHKHEIAAFKAYDFDKRKHSYLLGRISTKLALRELIPNEESSSFFIDRGVFSFPVLKSNKNYNLSVCISHCDDIGVSVVFPDEHPIGIDIEKIDKSRNKTMETCISTTEQEILSRLGLKNENGYTLIWTIKEALSKNLKTGFSLNLQALEIEKIDILGDIFIGKFKNLIQYKSFSQISGNYLLTIILPSATEANLSKLWLDFTSKTQSS